MKTLTRLVLPTVLLSLLAACAAPPQGGPTEALRNYCLRDGFGPEGSENWTYCLRTYSVGGSGIELDESRAGLGQP
ncbi:hypothetical protein OCH7691_02508 [Oceanibacterium hippocampi]|uniref:Lipoprotein n=1 Tax=Oceanibacterium hippocampi TaxID=745714 RepID=A0A1Y5TCL7_9PROT|nr:hypothetical protein OCH7691_02508 [Oceanibacterium hippocampi]